MAKLLPATLLPLFIQDLARHGELHGPVLTDQGVVGFGPVSSMHDLLLDYHRTLLPPKKYLLPPRQATFSCDPASGYQRVPEPERQPVILLGLHQCDLAGIGYLDKVFLTEQPDPHYAAKRSRLVLVGLSCEPDSYCFCGSLGHTEAPCDLFMEQSGPDFVLSARSPLGSALFDSVSSRLEECEPVVAGISAAPEEKIIHDAVCAGETFADSPLWEEFARRCLSCGACSLCCPTCYCFDVRETADLGTEKSTRLREWDNCLFRYHGEIAGGQNFRPSRIERFHYRYQHKYLGFGPTRGIISCVGCGRCRDVCPVKIDLLELFEQPSCGFPSRPPNYMPDSCHGEVPSITERDYSPSIPAAAIIRDLQPLSADTVLFTVELVTPHLQEKCTGAPGQFVQFSVPGGGEIPISIAGMQTYGTYDLCIRKVGHVTAMAHQLKPGDHVGVRGPFGNGFPVDDWKGLDILMMAGGLGIAPLRSLLLHLLDHRNDFGNITFMYGARDPAALLFRDELFQLSCRQDFRLLLTVDFLTGELPQGLACKTGLVTDLLSSSGLGVAGSVAAICGPPALYRCVVPELIHLGMESRKIYLSLERRMKCGNGICCHCAIGDLFCCTDGPVFSYAQLQHIPEAL